MELVGFFQRILPSSTTRSKTPVIERNAEDDFAEATKLQTLQTENKSRLEITADFRRLNVLLMIVQEYDNVKVGHKVATATVSQAKVQATISKSMLIFNYHTT